MRRMMQRQAMQCHDSRRRCELAAELSEHNFTSDWCELHT